ncbi:MAG: molybdopterin biosynthesis protein [Ardenticatenaceae bacterium]|nr:molybdopterin biosynthesis protein [Ardenticatenaceae bacterium]
MKRHIYLEDIPLDEAWAVFSAALQAEQLWQPFLTELIPVSEANGRITAEAVFAKISAPHYHASAMDGYAVRAQDTHGATETSPKQLALAEGSAQAVNTGHALPSWANSVIMIEHTQPVTLADGRSAIEIRAAVPPWHHVRPMGEDMVATELVLPANHKLRPVDLGALAGSGHAEVMVYGRPRVAIIPTGTELVSVETAVTDGIYPGQIIEYNSLVLAAQVENWGGIPTRWPMVQDNFVAIKTAVSEAAQHHDLILINAGSSAGSEDYTAHVVQELGRLLVHGVAVRPGHPVILGMIEPGKGAREQGRTGDSPLQPFTHSPLPIIGVPGYPVSAALTGEIFVEPLLARWQGQPPHQPDTLQAMLTRKLVSPTGDDDYVRVSVGKVGEKVMVTPISRGAGVITSLVRADGIVRIPRFSEGADAGSDVKVHLYRTPREIEKTIVVIGSHDLTLDLLAQHLAEKEGAWRLMSANVGSLGGLVALRRGESHLGGSHLLDPETGIYNESYVRRYLPGQEIVLVTLVGREQGWIVPPGNPKGLAGWADAANLDVQIVNRQRGAGTRVLLDYELGQLGIAPEQVRGYEREEYTHLAVAAAVASGVADAGLGIRGAARALDLDFVPLAHEQYQLVMPKTHYEGELLRPLLDLLHDDKFRTAVANLPGYDVTPMGQTSFLTT